MKKKDSLALAVFLLLGNIAMSSAQENTGDQDRFLSQRNSVPGASTATVR